MGIIRAIGQAIGGTLADQWLEVIEADDMSDKTVFTSGVLIRKGQNTKGTGNTVSNGSIIHVYDNQFMMLVDGGKIVDYTAEPGYYKVDKRHLTSAVTTIKAEDIMMPGVSTIDKMLEGHVPGMIFMQNSGQVGATPRLRIRGTSTILGTQEP